MFTRTVLASLIGLSLIASAASPVSALTPDEIQAQIRQLLTRVAELTAQLNVLRNNSASPTVAPNIAPGFPGIARRICTISLRPFFLGEQNEDVKAFQEFLQNEGYFDRAPTGYFGDMTKQWLQRWQAAQGFEAAGSVGPRTIERIRIWCAGHTASNVFSATPTSGAAPLTVTFKSMVGGFRPTGISYTIDFGDGMNERANECSAPADVCVSAGVNTHTYTANGTYNATLTRVTDPCPDDGDPATPRCLAAVQSEIIGKAQIVVGSTSCTKEYRPVCGAKPVVCITAPCNPVPTTYSNTCMMSADGASLLHEGQCRGATNMPPTISGFSGPTTLAIKTNGTWTINASDPEGGTLSYKVLWGDENTYGFGYLSSLAVQEFVQATSFTHAYAAAGTYTVTIIVRDNAGQESKATATVNVGDTPVVCTMEYAPVCGRPAGCANTCAPGMACPAICQLYNPQTYGNRCALNSAGAQFLHTGECTSTSGNWY